MPTFPLTTTAGPGAGPTPDAAVPMGVVGPGPLDLTRPAIEGSPMPLARPPPNPPPPPPLLPSPLLSRPNPQFSAAIPDLTFGHCVGSEKTEPSMPSICAAPPTSDCPSDDMSGPL